MPPRDLTFVNPFLLCPRDSPLDPRSENFSSQAWVTNFQGYAAQHCPEVLPSRIGVAFKRLDVYGLSQKTDYQKTVGNVFLQLGSVYNWMRKKHQPLTQILDDFTGVVEAGELLLVLGRPGSGCTTFLRTISGDTDGLFVHAQAELNYQGISADDMRTKFRGEAIYMSEQDVHLPEMTVGQTLLLAAKCRAPRDGTIPGVNRNIYAEHMNEVILATYGLMKTKNTIVGSNTIRGVSGGERKRVSIAEAALSRSVIQCWDNSTRGLDSANALEFCRNLRLSSEVSGVTGFVSMYQTSEQAYKLFHKVTVLYDGRQIFFGQSNEAKDYFYEMGFECAARQSTADFLTSITSPTERVVRVGYEGHTPNTRDDFVKQWVNSSNHAKLTRQVEDFYEQYPISGESAKDFATRRQVTQAAGMSPNSPFTLSLSQQVNVCMEREAYRLKGDKSITLSRLISNQILALIVGSLFINLTASTTDFYKRDALIFFGTLINAFSSALEILNIFKQLQTVYKYNRYGLHRPITESIASAICDMPFKIVNSIIFNSILYFMSHLHQTTAAFFTFLLFSFFISLTLSMGYRTLAAVSRSLDQALCPSAIITLAFMIFAGFVVPYSYIPAAFRWIVYINPLAYCFEALMINEYHGRNFTCAIIVPSGEGYQDIGAANQMCSVVGAIPGIDTVSGTEYIRILYGYKPEHLWRNFGIIIVFLIFFTMTYLVASELISPKKSKGNVLQFKRGYKPRDTPRFDDIEMTTRTRYRFAPEPVPQVPEQIVNTLQRHESVLQWRDLSYSVPKDKNGDRKILDSVQGWVQPGTLTAIMGPSGAGKTTLLDVLATRDTFGKAAGEVLVDGASRDKSFQRKTGYATQSDIHLPTSTVREAMCFQALLCQSNKLSRKEKTAYVEEIITLLGMESYADAIIGVPGEGLNIEQRKKLTIGVELASRPEHLLFLDEPTSGLDSQTSWTILDLLEKLTSHGQAILCTIHQPSAMLLQRFDRLLFLGPNGKTVYFGELGPDCKTIVAYFEKQGAGACPPDANPAEWIMEVVGCVNGWSSRVDWGYIWTQSIEYKELTDYLATLEMDLIRTGRHNAYEHDQDEFAASYPSQLWDCLIRINRQYWRTPSYIYSKFLLCSLTSLLLGFSFYKSDNTIQGLQNQTFAIFMLLTLGSNFIPQILPNMVLQRSIFEARERPAKTYSWIVFMFANILVEIPYNTLMAALIYLGMYYPIGWYRNAIITDTVTERGVVMSLFVWVFILYAATFAAMIQAGLELAEMAGNIANVIFTLFYIFSGILVPFHSIPRYWIWMYHLSPFKYLMDGFLSAALSNATAYCSAVEFLKFEPAFDKTCLDYLTPYMKTAGGYIKDSTSTTLCEYCPISDTNTFLDILNSSYDHHWRNLGVMFAFCILNVLAAMALYSIARWPKRPSTLAEKIDQQNLMAEGLTQVMFVPQGGIARVDRIPTFEEREENARQAASMEPHQRPQLTQPPSRAHRGDQSPFGE